jgi:protein-tyrosine kinase
MSRNYELLTQAERGHELFQTPPPPMPPAVQSAVAQPVQPTLEGIPAAGSPASRPRTGWREMMRGKNRAASVGSLSPGSGIARRLDIESLTWQEELKLVQRLFLSSEAATRKVVAFVGAEERDGSNRVCARSAEILASQVKGTVCVVDANLRAPSLHLHFKTENTKGFAEAALQTGPVTAFVTQFAATNLWLMTAGTLSAASNLVLPVDLVRARVEQLRAEFDHVLIHTGPATQDASSLLLGQLADGVVLVVRAHRTRRAKALEARQRLQSVAARLLGTVLDQRTFPIPEPLYSRL